MTEDSFGEPNASLANVPPNHRSGYVAIVGKPNVGKSTLLNAWLGTKLAPVSTKPQTTRVRLLGILTRADAQVIFVDTPGIHQPRTKLGEQMVLAARQAMSDADVVLLIVDASARPSHEDQEAARLLSGAAQVPVILVLNKVDLLGAKGHPEHREAYEPLGRFDGTFGVSALTGQGLDGLLEAVIARLPLGPRYYPEDQLTDQEERFVVAELVREQALGLLQQEVPHALAVLVDEFKERPNDVVYVAATLYVEKDSQKGIVIGQGGDMLKRIGTASRIVMEDFLARRVYLELWVKVRKNWRQSDTQLKRLGLHG